MNVITDGNTILGLPPVREPARPSALRHLAKPAVKMRREQLLDLAADAAQYGAWELTGKRDHVERVCRDYGDISCELHEANLENLRLRALLAQQSQRSATDAHLMLAFERLSLKLTGETCAQVLARMTAEEVEERTRMAVELAERSAVQRAERASTVARAYSAFSDDPDTIVVEVPGE